MGDDGKWIQGMSHKDKLEWVRDAVTELRGLMAEMPSVPQGGLDPVDDLRFSAEVLVGLDRAYNALTTLLRLCGEADRSNAPGRPPHP